MADNIDIEGAIRSSGLFAGCSDDEITAVAEVCKKVTYKAQEVIFEEGSDGTMLYFISEGRVNVELSMAGTTVSQRIYQAKDKELFGEMALVDGNRRSATTRALDDLSLICLDRHDFLALVEKNHRLGFLVMRNMSHILADKLRDTNMSLRNALQQQQSFIV